MAPIRNKAYSNIKKSTRYTIHQKSTHSSPYDKNASHQTEKLLERIKAKFVSLKTRPPPKMKPPLHEKKKSDSSLNLFEEQVYPLRQENLFKAKTARPPQKAAWTFFRGDLVRVVAGPLAGQSGRVTQFFKERNVVVVNGISSFRTDFQRLMKNPAMSGSKPLRPLGIMDVDAPIPSENLRHIGLEACFYKIKLNLELKFIIFYFVDRKKIF